MRYKLIHNIKATPFEEKEAKLAATKIMKEIEELSPGFDVITDISTIQSSDVEAAEELTKVHQMLKNTGVHQIVRVIGQQVEQVVGKLQFDIVSKGTGIEAITVDTVAEAEACLDKMAAEKPHSASKMNKVLPLRKA